MKRLVLEDPPQEWYPDAVTDIVNAFHEYGYEISRRDAEIAWQRYSESMSAGWLGFPDDAGEILDAIIGQFKEIYTEE